MKETMNVRVSGTGGSVMAPVIARPLPGPSVPENLSSCISCHQRDAVIWEDFPDQRYAVCPPCSRWADRQIPEWVKA